MITEYDKRQEAEDYIKDKMRELSITCRHYNIPFFMTVAIANTKQETEYYSDGVSPASMGLDLKDDKFRKHVLVNNGFEVVPAKKTALHLTQASAMSLADAYEKSDEDMVAEILERENNKGIKPLTREEVESVKKAEEETARRKSRKLGRPKGSTKASKQAKAEEAERNSEEDRDDQMPKGIDFN